MTESAPLGTFCRLSDEFADASVDEQYAIRVLQGRPSPFIELRVQGEHGLMPWDGSSMGELEMRGPWVASAYYNNAEGADRFTDDGWFKTGDVVSIDQRGYVKIQDRSKDVIKSGGEWISSIDLENALLNHPAVAEAAVIAIPDPKWQERPMAIVVLKDGKRVEERELIEFLAPSFVKWWLPDKVAFVEALPHTSTGKLQKSALRAQFQG
jgi:fatty-acyl-CoA synthase